MRIGQTVLRQNKRSGKGFDFEGLLRGIGRRMRSWRLADSTFQGMLSVREFANLTLNLVRLDAIRIEPAQEETSTAILERAQKLRKQHVEEMNTLYDRLAEDYLGEAVDAYYSLDDTFTIPEIDVRIAF